MIGLCLFKSIVLEGYLQNQILLRQALEGNDIVAQELRNLYLIFWLNKVIC